MRMLALLAALVMPALLVAAPVPKGKVKDEEAIVGTWQAVSVDDGTGKVMPPERAAMITVKFDKGGKMASRFTPDPESEGTFTLHPSTTPKATDLTADGETYQGVYEVDGDTLKLCFGRRRARPTEFKADPKANVFVMTLKRVRDEKKDK